MWEKIRVVFTIPELRQKILLTLLLAGDLSRGLANPAADRRSRQRCGHFQAADRRPRQACSSRWPCSAPASSARPRSSAWASCPTSPPRLSSSCWAASGRPWKNCKRKARAGARKSTNTPAMPRWCCASAKAGSTWAVLSRAAWHGPRVDAQRQRPLSFGWQLTAVLTMTAGTVFLMWLGEQIDEYGIGNGISLLIMAGILARMPRPARIDRPMFAEQARVGRRPRQAGHRKDAGADRAVRGRGGRRGVHHPGPAAHPHAKRQARPRPHASSAARGNTCRCGSTRPA